METTAAIDEEDAQDEAPPVADTVPIGRWDRVDSLIVLGAAVATFLVHPIHLILSRPYWLDEAWVAVLTRVPLSQLRHLSSSTPIGFIALLRLVPGSGEQRGRLVVLAFSAATVVMAYTLVRWCCWTSKGWARVAAAGAALVVMLAPLSLARNDLKQYTCDAFCAVVVLAVATLVERPPGNTPVWWLSIAALVVLPFSSTSAFVSVAAFAGLLCSALASRSRRRTVEILVTGAATGVALAAFFGAVIIPNTNEKLRAYWNDFYLHGPPWHILHDSWNRLSAIRASLGMPVIAFVVLFVAGITMLVELRARAVAVAVPVLWVEMMLAARLRRYPFLDLRTSHFLLVSSLVVCAIGAAGIVYTVFRWDRRASSALGLGLVLIFISTNASHVGELHIRSEDARAQAVFVARHRSANDVILVNKAGGFAFAYYWPHGAISTETDNELSQGFLAQVAGVDALYTSGRTEADLISALRTATDRMRAAGPGCHLFIVRSHLVPADTHAWRAAFAALHLHPRSIQTGVEPLLELGPA